jgi:SAM-dependent methyltransferase
MANGIVLGLGPGSGNQFPRFNRSSISRIYGIEPNEPLFHQLRDETIERHGLGDIYVPINAALEDSKLLEETWNLGDGSIDSVVCMQVLCSVSNPDSAAKQIYRLLKPGGQLLFWEHTASQDLVTRQVQGEKIE